MLIPISNEFDPLYSTKGRMDGWSRTTLESCIKVVFFDESGRSSIKSYVVSEPMFSRQSPKNLTIPTRPPTACSLKLWRNAFGGRWVPQAECVGGLKKKILRV